MVESFKLPPIRQELGIYPAPPSQDGSPAWTLHDPSANKFYHLSWTAFEMLSRWNLGTSDVLVETVNRETTLLISEEDVIQLIRFLDQNYLLAPYGSARVLEGFHRQQISWPKWLLNNYLFFRVPIIRPQRILDKVGKWFCWVYTPWFLVAVIIASGAALFLILQKWESFWNSFTAYTTWEGILSLAVAVSLAKTVHEFGHALTAHKYGCRIPAMGIAFVVMFPMLYTDTNEVWKLPNRRDRLAVSLAGISAELLLALIAVWLWLFLPDGPVKAGAFILATSTWIMTIALNASPFMRFDGYFMLCDLTGIANLHARSFAFGSWWIRKILFGLSHPPPEPAAPARRFFFIAFAYMVWVYRLVVFLGIAILVYAYFFKALGIFLFVVEIGWFIVLPVYREIVSWWEMHPQMELNFAVIRTCCIIVLMIALFVIPWRDRVTAPALLSAAREYQYFTPVPAMVVEEPVRGRNYVRTGDILVHLHSHELQNRIEQVRISQSVARWHVEQQPFSEQMLMEGQILKRRLEEAGTELKGRKKEYEQLLMRAPFSGFILTRNDEIQPGVMLSSREQLYVLVDNTANKVDAFVSAQDIKRIRIGNRARFIPDALEFGTYDCRVTDIDKVNITFLEEPALGSPFGGPIAAHVDNKGKINPTSSLFRVSLGSCTPGDVPMLKLKGKISIKAERRSMVADGLRRGYEVLIRESGF
jgi:putative peptide zinc metalloprotease protein